MDERDIDTLMDMIEEVHRDYPYTIYRNRDWHTISQGGLSEAYSAGKLPRGLYQLLKEADENRNFVEDYVDAFYPDVEYTYSMGAFYWK